jgi:hypothetical protein
MGLDFMYLRQNSQRKSFGSRAYSCGYGDEYHVEISCFPNWMARGDRALEPAAEGFDLKKMVFAENFGSYILGGIFAQYNEKIGA